ncbi:unnamed protein product [Schistosoma bovis]|nr:unnamed protein product [Schistosoma bovis]
MVRLVLVHVASLLLFLQTSKQTDVESNHLEDLIKTNNGLYFVNLKANISREENEIKNSDPNGMKNIDEYISCRSDYVTGDAANYAWSHIREMQANYRRQYRE